MTEEAFNCWDGISTFPALMSQEDLDALDHQYHMDDLDVVLYDELVEEL